MGMRQRKWARKAAKRLKLVLGYCCACGCGRFQRLQFDCIIPQGDRHHKIEFSWRISFYRRQAKQGNLQLLAEPCHITKTKTERTKHK